MTTTYDVVVVGAGPVGLALAGLLGRGGHAVLVVERYRTAYGLPRAIRFDGEAMRLFQTLDIVGDIESEIVAADSYVWYGADGDVIVEIDSSRPAPSGWAASYAFWQPTLESALERAAVRSGSIELVRGWAATGLEQHDGLVHVRIDEADAAEPGGSVSEPRTRTVTARYVVGADGANSLVRRECGIDVEDFGFRERWLVVDVRPHDMSEWSSPPVAAQRCDPRRPTVLVRNGAQHRRWEFMLLPGEDAESFRDPASAWELLAPYIAPDEAELVRQAVYEFTGTLAREWRVGGVVLAGDSAHTMPPFMGEGMCTGLRDAANLAWRLDLLLRGVGPDSLLDAYARERRPHARALIEVSIAMGKVSCTTDPEQAAARDAAIRSGEAPPPPPLPDLVDGTLQQPPRPGDVAGQLTVQGRIRAPDGRSGRFDDVIGTGFALVTLTGDPATVLGEPERAFLRLLGARVVTLDESVPGALRDEDGALTGWMRERGISAFLARPDGYGFGAVENPAQVPALVDALQRHLTSQVPSTITP